MWQGESHSGSKRIFGNEPALTKDIFMTIKLPALLAGVVGAVAAPVMTLTVGAPPALAEEPSCSFELSAPQATTLPGGGAAVSATVRAVACTGLAEATDSFVCITAPNGANHCQRSPAWSTAEVFVTAGGSGTYTAKGKGCWGVFEQADCRDLAPVSATI
jgi:hypothetical protein